MTKARPLQNKVLIHPIKQPKMRGSIEVPNAERRKESKGVVISLGAQVETTELEPGDVVLYNAYSGDKIVFGKGGGYLVISEEHIVAKMEDSDIVLMDSESFKQLVEARRLELLQRFGEQSKLINMICESIVDRIESFTQAEGMEW